MQSNADHTTPPVTLSTLPSPHTGATTSTMNHGSNNSLSDALTSTTKFVPSSRPGYRRRSNVFHVYDFFATVDGREAGLRALQYSLRFTLYLRRHKLSSTLLNQLLALVSTLSAFRRLVALIDLASYIYHAWDPFYYLRAKRKGKGRAAASPTQPHSNMIARSEIDSNWQTSGAPSLGTRGAGGVLLPELSTLLHLTRQTFDLISTLADNIYLLSRLHLIPLKERRTRSMDRLADYSTLVAVSIGLIQVARSRREIITEGRQARKEAIKLEERLDNFEYWEGGSSTSTTTTSGATDSTLSSSVVVVDREERGRLADARLREEKLLRDQVRNQRRRLKSLRDELTGLWWERLRLGSDGLFAVWDVLELDLKSEMIKSWAGLSSSAIMLSQAWRDYVPSRN